MYIEPYAIALQAAYLSMTDNIIIARVGKDKVPSDTADDAYWWIFEQNKTMTGTIAKQDTHQI